MRKYSKLSILNTLIIVLLTVGCAESRETKGAIIGSTFNPLINYDWSAKSWYEYKVDDKIYIDTIYFYDGEQVLTEGEEIRVLYNPDNPKENNIKN